MPTPCTFARGASRDELISALLDLQPDCLVYMPRWPIVAELEQILRAGVNIVTTARLVTGAHYPDAAGERLVRAAEEGGASLYGTGASPMHIPNVIIASTALCRDISHIGVEEQMDGCMYPIVETWQSYGFGSLPDPELVKKGVLDGEPDYFEMMDVVAGGLGVTLDSYGVDAECATANEDRDLGFMTIAEGTIIGFTPEGVPIVVTRDPRPPAGSGSRG
jgi:hypothetical protein